MHNYLRRQGICARMYSHISSQPDIQSCAAFIANTLRLSTEPCLYNTWTVLRHNHILGGSSLSQHLSRMLSIIFETFHSNINSLSTMLVILGKKQYNSHDILKPNTLLGKHSIQCCKGCSWSSTGLDLEYKYVSGLSSEPPVHYHSLIQSVPFQEGASELPKNKFINRFSA